MASLDMRGKVPCATVQTCHGVTSHALIRPKAHLINTSKRCSSCASNAARLVVCTPTAHNSGPCSRSSSSSRAVQYGARPLSSFRQYCAAAGGVPPKQAAGASNQPIEDVDSNAAHHTDHILSTAAAAAAATPAPGTSQNPLLNNLSGAASFPPNTLGISAIEPSNTAAKLAGSSEGSPNAAVATTSRRVETIGAETSEAAGQTSNAQATPQQRPAVPYRGTAVVVGAGPAGTAAALYLAKGGYKVHVLERRGHPAAVEADKKRTYLIGLGERGLQALDGLGLPVPLSVGRPMRGSVYAYKSGKTVEDSFTPDTRIVGVDRQGLAGFLVNEAAVRYPEAISFHWNVEPDNFDLQGKRIGCTPAGSDSSAESFELQYDLLIGADGAGSTVREAVRQAVPGMQVKQLTSPVAEMEYKAFHDLPWNNDIRALLPSFSKQQAQAGPVTAAGTAAAAAAAGTAATSDPGMVFFAFNNPQPNQPSPGSITLYLNAGGSWSGTLYQPPGKFEAMHGDAITHEAAIRQFTPEGFPNEWIHVMAKQMADVKPSRISPMNYVSQLAAPKLGVVLLGDAGHNVTPQMGQGCNSALEDASVLAQALQRCDYDITTGLTHFNHIRAPQVHSLQRMEEENSWVRRPPNLTRDPLDKTLARIAWISFFMLLPLLRLLPGVRQAVHASLFQTIMSTTIPYNRLHAMIQAAPFVWAAVVSGVVWVVKTAVRFGISMLAKA